jgi:ornithine cyclodeaminase/alanine dehydrogenase-like protein (mu-crystallin family)
VEFGAKQAHPHHARYSGVIGGTSTANVQLHVWQQTLRLQSVLVPTDYDRNLKVCSNVFRQAFLTLQTH